MGFWTKHRHCERCAAKGRNIILARRLHGSAWAYFWHCKAHNGYAREEARWISHKQLRLWQSAGRLPDLEEIPILEHRGQNCEVCGHLGAEWHHFCPQSMEQHFDDRPEWRFFGAWLCKRHHDMWHEVVTPYMPGRLPSSRARAVILQYEQGFTKAFEQLFQLESIDQQEAV